MGPEKRTSSWPAGPGLHKQAGHMAAIASVDITSKNACQTGPSTYVNLEASVRSRGRDGGCGAERDLIEAGLNEPADAAGPWDLCCGACSWRVTLGEAVRGCGRRRCGAIDVGLGTRRDRRH